MMNLGWADIQRMSLWEYESRLYHWNDAHGGNDDDPGERPDPRTMQSMVDRLNAELRGQA